MTAYSRSACSRLPVFVNRYPSSDLPQNVMCLTNVTHGGEQTCFGDSGGPVFCLDPSGNNYQLMGVVSWMYGYCTGEAAVPTMHTFVPAYLAWIQDNIENLASPCAQNPCSGLSMCFAQEDSYVCVCMNGFSGPRCDKCGQNLTGTQGTFNGSNYVLGSYHNIDCEWTIVAPLGSTVELAFTSVSLSNWYYSSLYACNFTFIEVRQNNAYGQLLSKLCDYTLPDLITSSTAVYIRFLANSTTGSASFRASFRLVDITVDSVRLADGETSNKGRLQQYVDYQWVPVCGNNFDSNAASVVCRELGLSMHNATFSVRETSTSPADNRWYQCTGSEGRLAQCQTTQRNCSLHSVNITCNAPECGVVRGQGPTSRIVGGAAAADGQFPWTVMVLYYGDFRCGGTIVDPLHVITAARCLSSLSSFSAIRNTSTGMATTVNYLDTTYLQIIAGKQWYPTIRKYTGEQKLNISSAIYHERYQLDSGQYSNDIAVLRLERALIFDAKVSAICLPTVSPPLAPQCTVAGWGMTDEYNTQPDKLMWASMTVYNRTDCQLLESMTSTLAQHTMCLANVTRGQQACYKDYGDPAFCLDSSGSRYELFGVVSWAYNEYNCYATSAFPTVLTYVPDFLSWIQQSIEHLGSPCAVRPCPRTSTCRVKGTSFECVCPSGWSGPLCDNCGLNLIAPQGIFNASNMIFGSYRTVNCSWTIVTPMGSTVELAFLSLSYYYYCSSAFIEIRQKNASGQLLATLCGSSSSLPAPIVSNSSLYIRFYSDSSSYYYFKAFYTINEIIPDSVRLLNGETSSQGRLQHYVDYRWVPVCGNDFDSNAAYVVCRELGLSPHNATFSARENSSSAADNRWYQCTGSEDRLAQCQTTQRNCSLHSVNITCNAPECGVVRAQGPTSRIVGGAAAADGQFPWTVMVLYYGDFRCGGTIVDPLHVITAAGCLSSLSSLIAIRNTSTGMAMTVKYLDTTYLQISAGRQWYPTSIKFTGEQKVNISSAIYHERFQLDSGQYSNDIAILRLERPLTYDAKVSAICLPTTLSSMAPQCTVAGWGMTDEYDTQPDKLMWASMTVYNRTDCQLLESMTSTLAQHTMCLANLTHGQKACYKDFGSPAFCLDSSGSRYELFGVVSWTYDVYSCLNRTSFPTVLTYVPDFLPWIQQAIEHLESPCARQVCSSFSQCRESTNGTSYDCVCPDGLSGPLCNRCGQNLTSSVGNISSPNYPLPYPSSANCEWTIVISAGSTVVLTFIDINLECGFDYVEVRENSASGRQLTQRCSPTSPVQLASSTSLYIRFTSDGSVQYTGFKISYRVLSIEPPADSVRLVDGETTSKGTLQHYVEKSWVPVCGDGFDNNSASVVCRELGFSPRNATFSVTTTTNTSADNRWYLCTGSEDSLSHCSTLQRPCTLHNVFVNCSACINNTLGLNCSERCRCVHEHTLYCDRTSGSCLCTEGWEGSICADDVNECSLTCNGSHEVCNNFPGGFECSCAVGYARTYTGDCAGCVNNTFGHNCSENCSCVQEHTTFCDKVNGTCTCKAGWEGMACADDVNECLFMCSGRQEICTNVPGSFDCSCTTGFGRNANGFCVACANYTFGQNCSQKCICTQEHTLLCNPANGTCHCKEGWEGLTCADDVNECSFMCNRSHELCRNLPGTLECTCANGTARNTSGDCAGCTGYTFGPNCSQACSCVQENTLLCDPVSGSCKCREGWEGLACFDDVNECQFACNASHEVCRNSPGSFECSCSVGFARNYSGNCDVCANSTFGPNCSQKCSCVQNQTISCNPVNGTCDCKTGWEGTSCAEDVNECLLACNSSHEVCRNSHGTFECSCAVGYSRNSSGNCVGCTGYTFGPNCSQTCSCLQEHTLLCESVNGSCTCREGWEGLTCADDVNECQFTCNASHELCTNSPGGFECGCSAGYYKSPSRNCVLCANYTFGQNCSQNCNCVQEQTLACDPVSGACNCKTGWQGLTCADDVNECELRCNGSHEVCRNMPGNFECTCANGTARNTSGDCAACTSYKFGPNCSQTCSCLQEHSILCDPVSGICKCREGWNGLTCADDVNECQFTCNASHELCINSPGSFECGCSEGYNRSVSGKCVLCANNTFGQNCSQNCSCVQEQTLTCDPVSGKCNCKAGWQGLRCADDVNECELRCNGSHEMCRNMPGSFECTCANGTARNASGDCAGCTGYTFGSNCSQTCSCVQENTLLCDPVSGSCKCRNGWNGLTCADDVNECQFTCNASHELCINSPGSFECGCSVGYNRSVSGKCVLCSNYTFGENCSQNCKCVQEQTLTCDPANGTCNCKTGWQGLTCADDVNECELRCNGSHEMCRNMPGSFECTCANGTARDASGDCAGCSGYTFGSNCSQTCSCVQENTLLCDPVSGSCKCRDGWNGFTCADDVNECQFTCNGSHELCINSPGRFECVCSVGYNRSVSGKCVLCGNYTFGRNCSQNCSCVQEHTLTCDPVSGTCNCKTGWQGLTCADDVNECELRCNGSHEVCRNVPGSFECTCANGTARNASGDCAGCSGLTFGSNCSQTCSCVQENTLLCDPVSGSCKCRDGWNGLTCADDVNECQFTCNASNEVCKNSLGGFECSCSVGYHKNLNGNCIVCSNLTFGPNCSQECNCSRQNSLSCDAVNGSCECNAGWEGSTCAEDINECVSSVCTKGQEVCRNYLGGYECVCANNTARNSSGYCVATSSIPLVITIKVNLELDWQNATSIKILMAQIQKALEALLVKKASGVLIVKVKNIRKGSIIVDAEVSVAQTGAVEATSVLMKDLNNLVNTPLPVGNETGSTTVQVAGTEVSNNTRPCALLKVLHLCDSPNEQCEDSSGYAVCKQLQDTNQDFEMWKVILIAGLCGTGLIVALIVVVACCICRRQGSKDSSVSDNDTLQNRTDRPTRSHQYAFYNPTVDGKYFYSSLYGNSQVQTPSGSTANPGTAAGQVNLPRVRVTHRQGPHKGASPVPSPHYSVRL